MSSDADKMWEEMTGGRSAKSSTTPSQPARPTSSAAPASDTDLFPPSPAATPKPVAGPATKPGIPAAAIYVALAVVVTVAVALSVWVLTSKRAARTAPVVADPAQTSSTPAAPSRAGMLNLNTATAAQLRTLPDVGPSLADKIIDYRTKHGSFRTVDELDSVSGIGPKTMAKLRPLVYVE